MKKLGSTAIKKTTVMTAVGGVIKKNPFLTAALVAAAAGSIVCALFPPLVLEKIINRLGDGSPILLSAALIYFGSLALSGVCDFLKEVSITFFGQKITHGLRGVMCRKISRLPASYFVDSESGSVVSRFTNDVEAVESLFTNGFIGMFVDFGKIISIIIVIFTRSVGLGLILVAVTPLIAVFTRAVQKRMLKAQLENRVEEAKVNNHIPESLSNLRMIRSYSKQKYMEDRYDGYIGASYRAIEKSNFYDSIYSPVINVVNALIIAVVMVMSAKGEGYGALFGVSVGTAVAMISYIGKIFTPIESLGMEFQSIQSAVAGIKRVDEFLSTPERAPAALRVGPETVSMDPRAVSFSDVVFSYDGENRVLDGLSFDIARGENVTFAGRTGAGKSTVFRLILGMYEPEKGNVSVFGCRAADIADADKRGLFGYIEQTFRFVPGTVLDQITLSDVTISREAAERAARVAGIHDMIASLPKGYDTLVAEGMFSKGQEQLLAIARAVAADPPLMLLDEITANLDAETEERVLGALKNAGEGRTVVSISHRIYAKTNTGRIIDISRARRE